MATAEAGGEGFEFLSDPVDRFPLPDLEACGGGAPDVVPGQNLMETASEPNIVDAPTLLTLQVNPNSGGDGLSLSAPPDSDDPQATGWTKSSQAISEVHAGHAPTERPPCTGRVCTLEKSLRRYAEKKTDTVVVPEAGTSFDSPEEAYDHYNLYSWEVGFGIRYGKRRLNVGRMKCMQ